MQIQNLIACKKDQSRVNEKKLRLVGYLVFLPQMFCKCVLTHHICCMSKHEVKTAFTVFGRVENAKEIGHLLSIQNKVSKAVQM